MNCALDIACWRITSRCNRHCPFCYGPETPDLETKEILKIIDVLKEHEVKALGITGGEPLIRNDIELILEHAKKQGFTICLTTNADLFLKYEKAIIKNVDVVGLPIEAGCEKIHDSLRGEGNFLNVLTALEKLSSKNIPVHIGTVLNKKNAGELLAIEKLLSKYASNIVYWKVYELVYYPDRSKQAIKDLALENQSLPELGKYLGKEKICYQNAKNRSQAHFLINPNGEVILPTTVKNITRDLVLGNLLDEDNSRIFKKWKRGVKDKNYQCNLCAARIKMASYYSK